MNSKYMCYNLSFIPGFKNLIKIGNIPPEFEKYYKLNHYITKSNEEYTIVSYNKDLLCIDLINVYGLLRSVILSGNKVVLFSPPKSLSGESFMYKYPEKKDTIIAEEFIEGTMINVFFDSTHSCWKIATRNTIDANVSFYQNSPTFNKMFSDACNGLDIQKLDKSQCYSFVLQHPENKIVNHIKKPELYLVNVYQIYQEDDDVCVYNIPIDIVIQADNMKNSNVKIPTKIEFETYTELLEKYASGNTPYNIMGVIIKNTQTGDRTKFRNPIYEEVKQLRGNQPKLQYQYLCLRHSGKIPDFLHYFPETKSQLSQFRDQVHMFTNNLHKNYIDCYVKKNKPLKEYPEQYRTHMFKLHEHFINDLMPNKNYVNNTVVIKYINNLNPSLLMHCLNFNMKKHYIDAVRMRNLH